MSNGKENGTPRRAERAPWEEDRRPYVDALNRALAGRTFLWSGAGERVRVEDPTLGAKAFLVLQTDVQPKGLRVHLRGPASMVNMTVQLRTEGGRSELSSTNEGGFCIFVRSSGDGDTFTLSVADRTREDVPTSDLQREGLPENLLGEAVERARRMYRMLGLPVENGSLRVPVALAEGVRRKMQERLGEEASLAEQDALYVLQDRLSGY
ncbi:MAG: hypothetical protein PHI23_00840 [Candidatus Peribacteraceae bacterium]|nr:hypothetical protein [Candidatus Peribacteraceae bacterium]